MTEEFPARYPFMPGLISVDELVPDEHLITPTSDRFLADKFRAGELMFFNFSPIFTYAGLTSLEDPIQDLVNRGVLPCNSVSILSFQHKVFDQQQLPDNHWNYRLWSVPRNLWSTVEMAICGWGAVQSKKRRIWRAKPFRLRIVDPSYFHFHSQAPADWAEFSIVVTVIGLDGNVFGVGARPAAEPWQPVPLSPIAPAEELRIMAARMFSTPDTVTVQVLEQGALQDAHGLPRPG